MAGQGNAAVLLPVFRFRVDFYDHGHSDSNGLARGMFSECSGLEISMEHKTVKEGGQNYRLKQFAGRVPILGVCLGHQSIGQAFGGHIVHAQAIMHGKTSMVSHNDAGVFKGLPNPFEATRYHSLVIEPVSLPECLEVTAWTMDDNGERGEIMGVRHKTLAVEGVQFHPESILTHCGHDLLRNFLNQQE